MMYLKHIQTLPPLFMSVYFISEHPHGFSVPRETGAPNFVRLSSAKICTMCEEPKGVEGVLARVK
jgi:hypothetical protein